jgi:HAD superfamily hydrolase (TIGR01509 family)
MIKAVIFDMDGLLVDSEPLSYEAIRMTFDKYGFHLTEEEFITHYLKRGMSTKDLIKKYLLKMPIEDVINMKNSLFERLIREKLKLMLGVNEILELSRENFKTALVTHTKAKFVEMMLNKFGILEYFDVMICRGDYNKAKPDPECYLLASEKLGVEPSECLALEDSERGLLAAKAAGMKCIAVPNEFTKDLDFSKADLVVKNLKEINLKIMKSI